MIIRKIDISLYSIAVSVFDLQVEAYELESHLFGRDYIPYLENSVSELSQSLEDFYGCYDDNILCGIISAKLEQNVLEICRLMTKPAYQRKGIGSQLFEYICSVYSFKTLRTQATSLNIPAVTFYKRKGMTPVESLSLPTRKLKLLTFYVKYEI